MIPRCKVNKEKINDSSLVMSADNVVVITPTATGVTNHSGYGNSYYYKKGSKVHVHLGLKIDVTTLVQISTLPEGYRPKGVIGSIGLGSEINNYSGVQITEAGLIQCRAANGYCLIDVEYDAFN